MAERDLDYLERRATAEAALAQRAKCPAAVKAHDDMSKAYRRNADALRRAPSDPR
jgi:hypothetical protein